MPIVHVSVVQFCSPASIPGPKTSARAAEHELFFDTDLGVLKVTHKASGSVFWVPASNVASFQAVSAEKAQALHAPPPPPKVEAPPEPVDDTIVVKKVDGKVKVIEPKGKKP